MVGINDAHFKSTFRARPAARSATRCIAAWFLYRRCERRIMPDRDSRCRSPAARIGCEAQSSSPFALPLWPGVPPRRGRRACRRRHRRSRHSMMRRFRSWSPGRASPPVKSPSSRCALRPIIAYSVPTLWRHRAIGDSMTWRCHGRARSEFGRRLRMAHRCSLVARCGSRSESQANRALSQVRTAHLASISS